MLAPGLLYGCGEEVPVSSERIETEGAIVPGEEIDLERLTRGEVQLSVSKLEDYGTEAALYYKDDGEKLEYSLVMPQIPASDDAYLYLFQEACYEDGTLSGEPVAFKAKRRYWKIKFPYKKEYLFDQFVPALLIDGEYVPVASGVYVLNPEALAENQDAYPDVGSKKGLLLDPTMLKTTELTDLGVKHAIYNIPLSHIMGETTNAFLPTIEYEYEGRTYLFNGAAINGYDELFEYLEDLGMCATVVVLNDWNEQHLELIHPEARDQESGAYYYMFNAADAEGVQTLEAVASFLADRYSGGEHGIVHSWVIANEINQNKLWNYLNTVDVAYYAQEFERGMRIFYQAIKSEYANAKVYFSIDHDWNSNKTASPKYFNAKDLVRAFNDAALLHGNYDWGIAIHPYPQPMTRVNYWSQSYDKTQDAEIVSIMNLGVLTDFLSQDKYLDTNGEVRSITITELGFSSKSGEKLQAAAFAYCYYITQANPYIDAFIMNRQTDAPEEVKQGLAFGIYEYDHSPKYIKDVFRYIDTDQAAKYTDFMLNILEVDSLEEALSWAQ
jgi:peptidoglycan/xylan/chitin deacetylase (PgdA/CDA1 family)